VLPGYFGNLAAQSAVLYFAWCAHDAASGGAGEPCEPSRELVAHHHRACSAFNVSAAEVARVVAAAIEARAVCRRARAAAGLDPG
jgi:hypothetical protein